MSRPSIVNVARLANVSTATVSRVLNKNGTVRPDLHKRVMMAIEELQYEPSGIARNMRSQSTQTIGFLIADIQNPFFTDMVRAIEEMAYELQYTVLLGSSTNQEKKERLYLEVMAKERIAGFVIVPTSNQPATYKFRRPIPIVFVDRKVKGVNADAVLLHNHQGGYAAAKHLIDLGHTRIGLITASPVDHVTAERQEGFAQALTEAGIPVDPRLISSGNEAREEGGYRATMELLSQRPRPTALFAVNNVRTLGMLRAIKQLGLRVPDQVSVVGFDDSPWLSLLTPPLTTIRQPIYEMGAEAVRLLMKRISGGMDEPPIETRIAPTFVQRDSTASPG